MENNKGRVFASKYRLIEELGRGGMGSVWKAKHLTLDSFVAVKLIDPRLASSRDALDRFVREAQAAARLRSAHVVQVLDYGVDEETPFLVMELLEGESLSERLERVQRLGLGKTVHVLKQVGRALTRAHEVGIVHRDLKPENIYLVQEDAFTEVAKVLDFGIAKVSSAQATGRTQTGIVMGTPLYMSPEQAEGRKSIDHRADVWSLAIIAFECLLGRPPFEQETISQIILAICAWPLPVPSQHGNVPPGFDQWFARAAARSVEERFQSVAEMVAALERLVESLAEDRTELASDNVPTTEQVDAPRLGRSPGTGSAEAQQSKAVAEVPSKVASSCSQNPDPVGDAAREAGPPNDNRKPPHTDRSQSGVSGAGATGVAAAATVGVELPTPHPATTHPAATSHPATSREAIAPTVATGQRVGIAAVGGVLVGVALFSMRLCSPAEPPQASPTHALHAAASASLELHPPSAAAPISPPPLEERRGTAESSPSASNTRPRRLPSDAAHLPGKQERDPSGPASTQQPPRDSNNGGDSSRKRRARPDPPSKPHATPPQSARVQAPPTSNASPPRPSPRRPAALRCVTDAFSGRLRLVASGGQACTKDRFSGRLKLTR